MYTFGTIYNRHLQGNNNNNNNNNNNKTEHLLLAARGVGFMGNAIGIIKNFHNTLSNVNKWSHCLNFQSTRAQIQLIRINQLEAK